METLVVNDVKENGSKGGQLADEESNEVDTE